VAAGRLKLFYALGNESAGVDRGRHAATGAKAKHRDLPGASCVATERTRARQALNLPDAPQAQGRPRVLPFGNRC
jgi:hypothetical protein